MELTSDEAAGCRQPEARWLETGRAVIERALSAARAELGLEVAYLTEFVGRSQVVRATYGNAAAFGLDEGTSVVLEGSYCQRVLDGRLPFVVPDTDGHPETRALEVTTRAHLGAYVGVPVRFADGALYGTLCAASTTAEPQLAGRDVSFMHVLARMLADTIERERAEEDRRRRLEAASAAKSAFISTLSHELRTPLNAILGLAELMEGDGASPGHVEHLRHIRRAGAHLLALVGETLDLARIEAGQLSVRPEPVDAAGAVRDAVALMAPVAAGRGTILTVADGHGSSPLLEADRQRLHQSLLNLIGNAIKYGGGEITVTWRACGDHAEIAVADNGSGIVASDLASLFTPFERLGADAGAEQGTGLGLALTRQMIELMDGSLEVTSRAGSGTSFTIRLPRASCAPPTSGRAPVGEPSCVPPAALRVLCVEDDPGNLHLVDVALADRADVLGVACGAEAVRLAGRERPDVVLVDFRLPDMTGLDVVAALRSRRETSETPVVLLTGETDPDVARRASELGVSRLLTKPWRIEELQAAIDAAAHSRALDDTVRR